MAKAAAQTPSPSKKSAGPKAKAKAKVRKRAASGLAPADHRVLRALAAATAQEHEESDTIAREFERHVCAEHSAATAVHYRRCFQRLFRLHKRAFSAMASAAFVDIVRQMRDTNARAYAASMKAFGVFWHKKNISSVQEPEDGNSKAAPAKDRIRFPAVMKSFEKHLEMKHTPTTAVVYGRIFKTLFNSGGKSLDEMASKEYVPQTKPGQQQRILRASANAFKKFFARKRGRVKCETSRKPLYGKAKATSSRKPVRNKSGEEEAIGLAQGLRPFFDHISATKGRRTAVDYHVALRKLFRWHGESLDTMASAEYLERVRKMGLRTRDAAAVDAFRKFRSVEGLEQSSSTGAVQQRKLDKAQEPELCSSKAVPAEDKTRFPDVMKDFEKHLGKEHTPRVAVVYGRAFRTLFNSHGKSLDEIASKGYAPQTAHGHQQRILRASANAFKKFFAKKRAKDKAKSSRKLLCKKAGEEEPPGLAQGLQPFLDHINVTKGHRTAVDYRVALRKLFRWHGESLDTMASAAYVDRVRKMNLRTRHAAAVDAFRKFRRYGEGPEQSVSTGARPCKRKLPSSNAEVDADDVMQRFREELQPFVDHLRMNKNERTVVQYRRALQKLFREHGEPLEKMASKDYLARVRALKGQRTIAAAVMALCKFRKVPGIDRFDVDAEGVTPQELQQFYDHLRSKFGRGSAVQYEQAIRKLMLTHHQSLDAMASQEYLDKVRGMNWQHKYSSAVRALCKFRSDIAWNHIELKERANADALRRLNAARASRRPVSDSDILEVLRVLPFAQNKRRYNVMPKGTDWVHSMTFGIIGDWQGRVVFSRATAGLEHVVKLLCLWMERQLGVDLGAEAFPVTSINVNKGYAAARHRDKHNQGPSAIRSLGDFRGGLLQYWRTAASAASLDELRDEDAVVLDPRHDLAIFNGNQPHAVTPFEGERYSIVFFTCSGHKRAAPATRVRATRMGLRLPTAHLLASAEARVATP